MKPTQNNFAYIDAANLYRGVTYLGWQLDYAKFRVWLKEKAPGGDDIPQGSFPW